MIEDHWEQIDTHVIERIRRDPEMEVLRKYPESELKDWGRGILKNLGECLVAGKEAEMAACYEELGRKRYHQMIPLHESVRALQMLRETMIDWVRDQGFGRNSLEVYAEEELEHRVGDFFDGLVYHMVKGYEGELRHSMAMAAHR